MFPPSLLSFLIGAIEDVGGVYGPELLCLALRPCGIINEEDGQHQ